MRGLTIFSSNFLPESKKIITFPKMSNFSLNTNSRHNKSLILCDISNITFRMHTQKNTPTHPHNSTSQDPHIRHGHGCWIYNVKFSYCINATEPNGVKHKRAVSCKSPNADVHMQFLSRPFPSSPCISQLVFIYILLSCLSLWVIKPWKRRVRGKREEQVRQYYNDESESSPSCSWLISWHTIAVLNTLEVSSGN